MISLPARASVAQPMRLMTFDADAEDLEDGGDDEPNNHDEAGAPPC
jgi:hypothetical protein